MVDDELFSSIGGKRGGAGRRGIGGGGAAMAHVVILSFPSSVPRLNELNSPALGSRFGWGRLTSRKPAVGPEELRDDLQVVEKLRDGRGHVVHVRGDLLDAARAVVHVHVH